ncbi:MAG: flavodoxin family protein [Pseudorhodoplanes sp.]
MERQFLFLVSSARKHGNTESLARLAAGAISARHSQTWFHLADMRLEPFEDLRHDESGYSHPCGNEKVLLDQTLASSDIVFVTPLYWYSLPSNAKMYLDYWSKWLRLEGVDFRRGMAGKTLWVVCVLGDKDEEKARPLISTFRIIADYLKMSFGGVLLGNGSRPGDIGKDLPALENARSFFR